MAIKLRPIPPSLKRSVPNETEEDVDSRINTNEKKWQYQLRLGLSFFAVIMTVAIVGIFVFHMITPESWRWLSPEDLKNIRDLAVTIIVGLVLSVVTTNFFKKK